MYKKIILLIAALLLALEPLSAGLSIRFSTGPRHRHHHGHHYYYNSYPYYYNNYYYDNYYYNRYSVYYKRVSTSTVISTEYTDNHRILTLENGMRFRIQGDGIDWTDSKAKVYRKVTYDNYYGEIYRYGGYRLKIEGYRYPAYRLD